MKGCFNIPKSVNVRTKPTQSPQYAHKKSFAKFTMQFSKLRVEGNLLNLIKGIY